MLTVKNLTKKYASKEGVTVTALNGINLTFEEKGVVFILGKSGSGKSTLLNVLGGLDRYDAGDILIKGKSSKQFKGSDFDSYRNTYVGFVFQDSNLIEDFTVAKNLGLAMQLQHKKPDQAEIEELLAKVDLAGLSARNPNELSGGQIQRVAIARALIKKPDIIMADEPTGNLDSKTGAQVFNTLRQLGKEKLVLVVSHDRQSAETYADRIIELSDGNVIRDVKRHHVKEAEVSEAKIMENDTLVLKGGVSLSAKDIETINSWLSRDNDVVLHKTKRDDYQNQRNTYISTEETHPVYKEYDESAFKVIKSKLPWADAFKIGASNLKIKKFRLFMTILLSVIALSFFGLSDSLASFSIPQNTVDTLYDIHQPLYRIRKQIQIEYDDYDYYENSVMLQSDIDVFESRTQTSAALHYSRYFTLPGGNVTLEPGEEMLYDYYRTNIQGVIELQHFSDLGFTYEGEFPTGKEIAISDYLLDVLMKTNLNGKTITSASDVIGESVDLDGEIFVISAVFNTPFDHLQLKEDLRDGNYRKYMLLQDARDLILQQIIVEKGIVSEYLSSATTASLSVYMEGVRWGYFNSRRFDRLSENVTFANGYSTLANNQIAISPAMVSSLFPEDFNTVMTTTSSTPFEAALIVINQAVNENRNHVSTYAEGFIAGIIIDQLLSIVGVADITYDAFIFSNDFMDSYDIAASSPDGIYFNLSGNRNRDVSVIRYIINSEENVEGLRYTHFTIIQSSMQGIGFFFQILRPVFFWMSVVLAGFAILLLANFISMSIANKKKEIGILRAIGARSKDVFGIFFNESLLISGIGFVVTIILVITLTIVLNNAIGKSMDTMINVFVFGARQVFLLFLFAFSVAFIASLLPVRKIVRMKPIDAIRNK